MLQTKCQLLSAAPRVHPALQDQHRGHLVDDLAAPLDGHIGFAQQTVGLGGAQALVPEVDGQLEALAQFFREALHLFGLDPLGSAHAEGIAHDDFSDLVFADHLFQLGEIEALVLPVEGLNTLSGDAQQVRDGQADSLRANVQAQNSRVLRIQGVGWFRGHVAIISPGEETKKSLRCWNGNRRSPDPNDSCSDFGAPGS